MPNVGYVRDEVTNSLARWTKVRDCLSGDESVKLHDSEGAESSTGTNRYLPKPNAADLSAANTLRYRQYIERAVFYPVTGRTHTGLVGQAFQKDPTLELPAQLEVLETDCDGAGVGLISQAKKALGMVLAYGRAGLLTDYPKTAAPASKADMLKGELRPSLVLYDPWSVINWRTKMVGAKHVLTLVVIHESHIVEDDGFETKDDERWRVLSIEPSGIYRVGLWQQYKDGKETGFMETESYNPMDARGQNLREIPFTFLGSLNNDPLVDLAPLYDLASLNIAHYRNSADFEESCYMVGQPTPVFIGLTEHWAKEVLGGSMSLGSRGSIPLPTGADAKLLQVAPNIMPKEAMEIKERQMVAIGARLVEQREVQRTLGEARLEYAGEISTLGTCAKNVAAGCERALGWAGAFAGTDEPSTFTVYPDAELGRMTPEERNQLVLEWQAGAIVESEMRSKLQQAGVATLSLEEYRAEKEATVSYTPGTASTPQKLPVQGSPADEQQPTEGAA